MADAFRIDFDSTRLEQALERIGDTAAAAVRPAAQAGAQVLYEEVRQRVPQSDRQHVFYGKRAKYVFAPGTLRRSIYQVWSQDKSGPDRSTYHVAWNHRKAPYGFMVEFGTSRAPAHPFLRPAWDAARDRALKAADAEFTRILAEALP